MKKIALLFPGQGSQSKGMLSELAKDFIQVKKRFEEASDIIKKDLWAISQDDEQGFLNQTAYTQPILLTGNIACFEILTKEIDLPIAFLAGHSLGEYAALCAGKAIDFAKAVELVHIRGQLMQEAVEQGTGKMAAILGLSSEQVDEICNQIDGVYPANYNTPEQTVIAGKTESIEKALEIAKKQQAKRAILLPVSVPSHCPLMKPAAASFSFYLNQINWQDPQYPIIYNVDAKTRQNIDGIVSALGAQLYKPVQWVKLIEQLDKEGIDCFIEVGPGKVLSGLNKRIIPSKAALPFNNPKDFSVINQEINQ